MTSKFAVSCLLLHARSQRIVGDELEEHQLHQQHHHVKRVVAAPKTNQIDYLVGRAAPEKINTHNYYYA